MKHFLFLADDFTQRFRAIFFHGGPLRSVLWFVDYSFNRPVPNTFATQAVRARTLINIIDVTIRDLNPSPAHALSRDMALNNTSWGEKRTVMELRLLKINRAVF